MDKSLIILELSSEVDKLRKEIEFLKLSLEIQKCQTYACLSVADAWHSLYLSLESKNYAKH